LKGGRSSSGIKKKRLRTGGGHVRRTMVTGWGKGTEGNNRLDKHPMEKTGNWPYSYNEGGYRKHRGGRSGTDGREKKQKSPTPHTREFKWLGGEERE